MQTGYKIAIKNNNMTNLLRAEFYHVWYHTISIALLSTSIILS